MAFCVYRTSLNDKYYLGKSQEKSIAAGYKGSGTRLLSYFKKYPLKLWAVEILGVFEDEQAAFDFEATACTPETLKDPNCLNLVPGGRGGSGASRGPLPPETRAKLALASSKYRASAETRLKLSVAGKGRPMSLEARAKLSATKIAKNQGIRHAIAC